MHSGFENLSLREASEPRSHYRAGAAAPKNVKSDACFLERLEYADMAEAKSASAACNQTDRLPSEKSPQAMKIVLVLHRIGDES
jgi:hypothetical protein